MSHQQLRGRMPVEDWPDSMDSMENAHIFSNQNTCLGSLGIISVWNPNGKISNLRKTPPCFLGVQTHGDVPCLTKRNKNQTRADMMPGSI